MHRAPIPVLATDDDLARDLASPAAFDDQVDNIERLETHISWLILAGEFVYKIKKPIVLPFLDFSTLEKRKFMCEEEIRLNQEWAPELYIDVVPITVRDGTPRFGGEGEVIDYAVRMRRFDQEMALDNQLSSDNLTANDMLELATYVAARHADARIVDAGERDRGDVGLGSLRS